MKKSNRVCVGKGKNWKQDRGDATNQTSHPSGCRVPAQNTKSPFAKSASPQNTKEPFSPLTRLKKIRDLLNRDLEGNLHTEGLSSNFVGNLLFQEVEIKEDLSWFRRSLLEVESGRKTIKDLLRELGDDKT